MRGLIGVAVCVVALACASGASYAHDLGHTTEDHTLTKGDPLPGAPDFFTFAEGPGALRVVRSLPGASPIAGRANRRLSLSYFAQLTDFQLADEESPARVEFVDKGPSSAHRPHEAFHPWGIDWSFRQINQFTPASPHTQAGGARAPMDLGLLTGDQSDNQQFNETEWVRQLIEGGTPITPNSGVQDLRPIESRYSQCTGPSRAELVLDETSGDLPPEPIYTGVQDYDDLGFKSGDYWDPNEPFGQYEGFPTWPGLMDRAQALSFTPVGLRRNGVPVPTYVSNGNHDGLVQGNEDAIRAFEDIATGCFKVAATTSPPAPAEDPDPNDLLSPAGGFPTRPDEGRHFVDRVQMKRIYSDGIQPDDHGFAFVDPTELTASGFTATYWQRELKPGIRFISIDTVSDGGVVEESSQGNIDDPQFRWLQRELDAAQRAGDLVIAFGHHPIRSLSADVPDEAAQPCTGRYDANGEYSTPGERHGHDQNPGCDLDPRASTPVHLGESLRALLSSHSNVIAYVAGHTHENKILPCGSEDGCPAGGNWWEINTSAAPADWPQQSRLLEVMDNRDGTLSIFGTLTDQGGPLAVPPDGSNAAGFGNPELASISHAVGFNDPQVGDDSGEGDAQDQNVELLVDDPRTAAVSGTPGDDVIRGTPGPDVIRCGPGDDRVVTGDGDDVIYCGPGDDRVDSGRGNDRVYGQSGRDRLLARSGRDRLFGGTGADRLHGQRGRDRMAGGSRGDRMAGGSGRDRMGGGSGGDRMFGGTGGDRMRGGRGRDRLAGRRGNDLLIGGPHLDRLFGGPGRDRRVQ